MWRIELTTKTITAARKIGSQRADIGVMCFSLRLEMEQCYSVLPIQNSAHPSRGARLRLEPAVQPRECVVLHLQTEYVRLIVEAAFEPGGCAAPLVDRRDLLQGLLHPLERVERIPLALLHHERFRRHTADDVGQIHKSRKAGQKVHEAV